MAMKKETEAKKKKKTAKEKAPPSYAIQEGTTFRQLCEQLNIKGKDLIEALTGAGFNVNINDIIEDDILPSLSEIIKKPLTIKSIEESIKNQAMADEANLVLRPPVVTVMGHVDHGKTTLLDAIRKTNVAEREFGGITQHIGAYRITYKGKPITFIDTPGHEAFTKLRARGAQVTDIVVLVVAADDGVMPQTKEAIAHAKAAGVPILVAINKIDKAEANLDRVKQQLSKEGLLIEEWGGDTICVEISAKEKKNIDELLEMITLLSEVMEIKTNRQVPAQGVVLEARLDPRRGPLATVIVQLGVLRQGEAFVSGLCSGKVKAMFDEQGRPLKQAEPSVPVEILGFSEVPQAGDLFQAVADQDTADKIIAYRRSKLKKKEGPARPEKLTLDQLFKQLEEKEKKELPLIIKADVQGSVETLCDLIPSLSTDEVKINIIHASTGQITESDVLLASASNAIIIGYNTKAPAKIQEVAKEEHVEIRLYRVIYQLIDDLKKALAGLLEPEEKEVYLGRAEIRRIFNIPRVGVVAGCYVTDGKILHNAQARVIRNDEIIYTGRIASLKHLKNSVTEIKKGYECGIVLDKFKDIEKGDIIEAFIIEKETK